MSKVEDKVRALAQPVVDAKGLELVDVEFVKEGAHWYLRVFIDKPDGIDLDDCEAVSLELGPIIDEADPIPQEYLFEVSSPGLDRPLKKKEDYNRYQGRLVKVNTFAPVNGKKEWIGQLVGLTDNQVQLKVDNETVAIPFDKVAQARLEIEF